MSKKMKVSKSLKKKMMTSNKEIVEYESNTTEDVSSTQTKGSIDPPEEDRDS